MLTKRVLVLLFLSSIIAVVVIGNSNLNETVLAAVGFDPVQTHPDFWAYTDPRTGINYPYTAKEYIWHLGSVQASGPNPTSALRNNGYFYFGTQYAPSYNVPDIVWVWSEPDPNYGTRRKVFYEIWRWNPSLQPPQHHYMGNQTIPESGIYYEEEQWSSSGTDATFYRGMGLFGYAGENDQYDTIVYSSLGNCSSGTQGTIWPHILDNNWSKSEPFVGKINGGGCTPTDSTGYISVRQWDDWFTKSSTQRNTKCDTYFGSYYGQSLSTTNAICKNSENVGIFFQRYNWNSTHGCEFTIYAWGNSGSIEKDFYNGELLWSKWLSAGTGNPTENDSWWWQNCESQAMDMKQSTYLVYNGCYQISKSDGTTTTNCGPN